ncbi:uncharacterized protein LOC108488155 [Gossypium arboreum]|uniref:uncharacterized protein LOC108488155 n=1 Tax=Gossypium arboreum TaxID=29729 RepID=UPI000818FE94|nr:uncharacterized protein LOC108488155 [Gossypium arboreum]
MLRRLFIKLKRLKKLLRAISSKAFGNISCWVKEKQVELERLQLAELSEEAICGDIGQVQVELKNLKDAKEGFFWQQAKVLWLRDGNQSTWFFHNAIAVKRNKFTNKALFDDARNKLETHEMISSKIIEFYKGLLVTRDEIKVAIFEQGNDKAPNLDGYTAFFFKPKWSIVGDDCLTAVQHFLNTIELLTAFNATIITLVPKCENSSHIKEFGPISCCSSVYKCISKVFVNRITRYLPELISKSKRAFIKGRNIVDNTLLAHEFMRGVFWFNGFLYASLLLDFLSLLMVVSIVSLEGEGESGRDCLPTSLLLSGLLEVAAKHRAFKYHPKYLRMQLSHLSFANDLLIFAKEKLGVMTSIIGFKILKLLVRYLEVPLVSRKLSFSDCGSLIDKILAKYSSLLVHAILLPKAVLKKVSQICARFFWEVGTVLQQQVWSILAGEGSLCIAWIKEYILKGRSFWDISPNSVSSWNWRRMLKLKEVAACNVHNFPVDIVFPRSRISSNVDSLRRFGN